MGRRFLGGRVPVRLWFPLRLVSKGRECVALVISLDRYAIPSRAHLRRHLPAYLKCRPGTIHRLSRGSGSGVDQRPFFHWWRHMQIGWAERECRNRGMGIAWLRPPHVERLHGVEVTEQRALVGGSPVVRRTFSTPVGSVYEDERREPGTGQWRAMRSWIGNQAWTTERLIKPEAVPEVLHA